MCISAQRVTAVILTGMISMGICLTYFRVEVVQAQQAELQNPHRRLTRDCSACHTASGWHVITFDHSRTGFPLRGSHTEARVTCTSCHTLADFSSVSATCGSCHEDVHQGKLGSACETCHQETRWTSLNSIQIHANTTFPLTGSHVQLDCQACHVSEIENEFSFLRTTCGDCHQQTFFNAQTDVHQVVQADMACQKCHSTSSWEPAFFDHSQSAFSLTGAHVGLRCADCHQAGYTNTPTQCADCHLELYQAANNPNHIAANFPTNCETCHNTRTWQTTTWDHDGQFFPIFSGKHKGKWSQCADCHVDASNFKVFECIVCHEHRQDKMDRKHREVGGYVYVSTACLNCHPNGEGD